MLDLSSAIVQQKNKVASAGAWLILLEIAFPGESTIYLVHNNEEVVWNSITWLPFEFKLDSMTEDSKGSLPTYSIKVSNVGRELVALLDQTDGGTDGVVTLRVVNSELLGELTPAFIDVASIISCSVGLEWVTFTLGAESPLSVRSPRDRFLANHCRYKEFKGPKCGYTGVVGSCDRTFKTCKDLGNSLRFGGQPAVGLGGAIYV